MAALSHFQTLPLHIVEKTISYFVETYGKRLNSNSSLGFSLLHSCHRWRLSFSKLVLNRVCISYSENNNPQVLFPKWPTSIGQPIFSVDNIVKVVKFSYALQDNVSLDKAIEQLQQMRFDNFNFSSARALKINIAPNNIFEDMNIMQSLEGLLRHLCPMFLNMSDIEIRSNIYENDIIDYNASANFSSFIFCLSDKIKAITWKGFKLLSVFTPDNFIKSIELTRLDVVCGGNNDWFNTVVQKNSNSLKCLRAKGLNPSCIDSMIYNDNSEPVVYYSLETLYLGFDSDYLVYDDSRQCHFPILIKLEINTYNAVCSNIFFSNSGTLKYLNMTTVPRMVLFAKNHQIFKKEYFYCLETLHVSFYNNLRLNIDNNDSEYDVAFIKQFLQLRWQLKSLKTNANVQGSLFMSIVDAHSFSTLQRLGIRNVKLEFADILYVLQETPLLHYLFIRLNDSSPTVDDIDSYKLVKYITNKWQPLNKHLSYLKIGYNRSNDDEFNNSITVALLAVGCPKLYSILCSDSNQSVIEKHLHTLAELSEFRGFEEHLKSIKCVDLWMRIFDTQLEDFDTQLEDFEEFEELFL